VNRVFASKDNSDGGIFKVHKETGTVAKIESTGNITMAENINTRLTIPSSAPSGMTTGRWYISIV
jgi:hypothetical protein